MPRKGPGADPVMMALPVGVAVEHKRVQEGFLAAWGRVNKGNLAWNTTAFVFAHIPSPTQKTPGELPSLIPSGLINTFVPSLMLHSGDLGILPQRF